MASVVAFFLARVIFSSMAFALASSDGLALENVRGIRLSEAATTELLLEEASELEKEFLLDEAFELEMELRLLLTMVGDCCWCSRQIRAYN